MKNIKNFYLSEEEKQLIKEILCLLFDIEEEEEKEVGELLTQYNMIPTVENLTDLLNTVVNTTETE